MGYFYRYIEESLKAGTRSARTGGETTRYKIRKKFLSDIHTKNELTNYLSKKLYQALNSVTFVISYEKMCITNVDKLNENLKSHSHEEADTCIFLHALDVTARNLFTELVVYCSDNDVLLQLLHYFNDICSSTIFRSTSCDIHVRSMDTHLDS